MSRRVMIRKMVTHVESMNGMRAQEVLAHCSLEGRRWANDVRWNSLIPQGWKYSQAIRQSDPLQPLGQAHRRSALDFRKLYGIGENLLARDTCEQAVRPPRSNLRRETGLVSRHRVHRDGVLRDRVGQHADLVKTRQV
jgi:hypothetical protein